MFFYINYLIENNQIDEAKLVANKIEYISSTLLLSQSKSWVENKNFKEFNKIFSCKNYNDIIGEFLFLISNLYSSQDDIKKSNFYLNLSNYLNPKFILNSTLIAENFYLNKEYEKAKKVLKKIDKKYEFYYWFRIKKEAQIIIKEDGMIKELHLLVQSLAKLRNQMLKWFLILQIFIRIQKIMKKL